MHRRPGFAPLEFVIALPLVLAVAAALIWVGRAAWTRANVDTDPRAEAWSKRDHAGPGDVLKLDAALDPSYVESTRTRSVPGRNPLPVDPSFTATAGTIFSEWTFETLPFPELPPAEKEIVVHADLLEQLVRMNPRTLSEVQPLLGGLGDSKQIDPKMQPPIP